MAIVKDMMRSMHGGPVPEAAPAMPPEGLEDVGDVETPDTAVGLLDNAVQAIQMLSERVPEAAALAQRIEVLRPKAEAADESGGEELESGPESDLDEVASNPRY